jgi:2-phospho-L-lactate guanylyltransferase
MITRAPIWAVVPVKNTEGAKQRLADALTPPQRQQFALAMLEDVLTALAAARGLAGILMVTVDETAMQLAARYGAMVSHEDACAGHTAAVMGAAHALAADGRSLITLPGDVPLVTPADIESVIEASNASPGFTIVPAHDELGSNTILATPANAVPLRFGDNSFFPHLDAARACGIEPVVVPNPRLGLDIDAPEDLAAFLKVSSTTRARALLDQFMMSGAIAR